MGSTIPIFVIHLILNLLSENMPEVSLKHNYAMPELTSFSVL